MKSFPFATLIFIFLFLCSAFAPKDDRFRPDVKFGVDAASLNAYRQNATAYTVKQITHIRRPAHVSRDAPRFPAELKKAKFGANIIGLGQEADGDYHLVLVGLDGRDTMIAEIPDPDNQMLANHQNLRDNFSQARAWIQNHVDASPPHSITLLQDGRKVPATFTGLLFFDKKAHGKGHARNGIEMHPVFQIS